MVSEADANTATVNVTATPGNPTATPSQSTLSTTAAVNVSTPVTGNVVTQNQVPNTAPVIVGNKPKVTPQKPVTEIKKTVTPRIVSIRLFFIFFFFFALYSLLKTGKRCLQ